MTSKVVVGKRVSGEKGMPPGLMLYLVAAVLVVLAVRSFVGGDATMGGVYAAGAVVAGLVGRTLSGDAKRTTDIWSACPVCGVERQRSVMAIRNERDVSTPCEACIAYLRVNLDSLAVREEPDDALGGFYWVGHAQYQAVQMPTMCAVCGAPDAPRLRTLDPMTTADAGLIGAVASGVASEVAFDTGIAKANRRYGSNTPTSGAELDLRLREVEMRVCEKHTAITDRGVRYKDGDLAFSSYRHYKAFCELNHVMGRTAPSAADGPPEARVVSS